MPDLATEPQTAKQLFKNGLQLWLHSYLHLVLLTVLTVAVAIAPFFFFPEINNFKPHSVTKYFAKYYWLVIPYFILSLYFFSVIIFRLHMFLYNMQGGYKVAFAVALVRLPATLFAMIIAIILVTFGYLFLFFPGVYFTLVLAFFVPIILTKQPNPFLAFKECFILVNNNWWRCFFVLFSGMLLFNFIVWASEFLTKDLLVIHRPEGKIFVAYHLGRLIINSIYYPLMCSLLLVTLRDLQIRKNLRRP